MKRSSASCSAPVAYLHLRSLSCPSVLHGPRSFCSWTRPIAGQSDVVPLPKRHPLPHSGCRCRWGNMSRSKRSSSVATGHGLVVSISRWASSTFDASLSQLCNRLSLLSIQFPSNRSPFVRYGWVANASGANHLHLPCVVFEVSRGAYGPLAQHLALQFWAEVLLCGGALQYRCFVLSFGVIRVPLRRCFLLL